MIGGKLILFGSFLGALTLSLLLFSFSAGAELPRASEMQIEPGEVDDQPVQATRVEISPASAGNEKVVNNFENIECQVSSSFPESILQWCELITLYAEKRGLEPDLVAALIWQESGGKPQAYSSSGAVGLMQIMPNDGLAASFMCVNGPCFSNRPSIKELEDPEFNISYGTKMLAGLQVRTGDLREALKSYGPMNVGYYYADKVIGIYQRYGER